MTFILLVEDDVEARESLQLALEGAGHRVATAANGSEALQQWRQWQPELILLDLMLPGVPGLEVCRRVREVDQVIVKGKTEPVGVYEVLDYHTAETFPHLMDVVNYFNEGIAHYRNRDFGRSVRQFEEALRRHPGDKLAHTYIDRCRLLIENPPPDDWAGIWEMHEK